MRLVTKIGIGLMLIGGCSGLNTIALKELHLNRQPQQVVIEDSRTYSTTRSPTLRNIYLASAAVFFVGAVASCKYLEGPREHYN